MTGAGIIIVSGPPCSGKTTISRALAGRLSVPVFSKDGIKEVLYDVLGWKDREWVKQIGIASINLLFHIAAEQLERGHLVIMESNFDVRYDTKRFLSLQRTYAADFVQIFCTAEPETLFARYNKRAESGLRHPGHLDRVMLEEVKQNFHEGIWAPFEIGGALKHIDTTSFQVDYEGLVEWIQTCLRHKSVMLNT